MEGLLAVAGHVDGEAFLGTLDAPGAAGARFPDV
jgi:hypothetical protein